MFSLGNARLFFLFLLFLSTNSVSAEVRPSRVVNTKYGALRGLGITLPGRNLQPVEAFLGVPYASPPMGSLRFMPPVTPPHWRGVRMADRFGPVCPQRFPDISNGTEALNHMPAGRLEHLRRLIPYLRNQSEDCLYLNVYAPSPSSGRETSRLPVLVYIHGESFEWNAGNPYDGSVLASFGNVIVVTLNFRLGVLGFLPVNDGSARGNYGLMDQVAALHWVQENVGFFGGDPHNITIFGHGHGAACVNLLMLSPMAKGLFHRAIMMSGSALSPWAIARDSYTYARHLAKVLACPSHDSLSMVDCLRQRSVDDILRVDMRVPQHLTAFGPTVDGIVIAGEPLDLMAEFNEIYRQYDLMFGLTRVEAHYLFTASEEHYGIDPERRDRLLRTLVRNLFTFHQFEIFLTIINEYTDWTRPTEHPINIMDATADALGDALVGAPLVKSGELHSRINPKTFFYVFAYQSENTGFTQRLGCRHGEELPYIFGAPLHAGLSHFPRNFTRAEVGLAEAVMTYWTNFARNGDPNASPTTDSERSRGRYDRVGWPQYDTMHQKYLTIGTKPKVRDHYYAHRLSFWLNLFPKLHEAGSLALGPQHNLLPDHDNASTYEGIIRLVSLHPLDDPMFPRRNPPFMATSSTSLDIRNMSAAPAPPTTGAPVGIGGVPTPPPGNRTESLAVVMQQSTYSTALSVTIAIGCSLLVLNILIFAGIYYQHDRAAATAKSQRRGSTQYMQKVSLDEKPTVTSQVKPLPGSTPPPSPVGVTPNQLDTSTISASVLNSVPPPVIPPKPKLTPSTVRYKPDCQLQLKPISSPISTT